MERIGNCAKEGEEHEHLRRITGTWSDCSGYG